MWQCMFAYKSDMMSLGNTIPNVYMFSTCTKRFTTSASHENTTDIGIGIPFGKKGLDLHTHLHIQAVQSFLSVEQDFAGTSQGRGDNGCGRGGTEGTSEEHTEYIYL